MLKIAICDDSRADMEELERLFDEFHKYPIEYDVYFNPMELLQYCEAQEQAYHLYIFDIKMPEMDGITLAERIRRKDARALFIFLTHHAEYMKEAFNVVTFDYILKPISKKKLENILIKTIHYLEMTKRDFVFQFRKNHFRVDCGDILYFEKKGRQAIIHTVSETYMTNMKTEEIWKQLDVRSFGHIHSSYIVNFLHIKAIEGDELILDNGEKLFIARLHKQFLKESYVKFIEEKM